MMCSSFLGWGSDLDDLHASEAAVARRGAAEPVVVIDQDVVVVAANGGRLTKCYGQGHWAYGRVAAKDFAKATPKGSNNNELLVDDYDRLSGATARNGGFTGVRIVKV